MYIKDVLISMKTLMQTMLEDGNIEASSHVLGSDSASTVLKVPARMLQSKHIRIQVLADSKLRQLSHIYYVLDVPVAFLLKHLQAAV
jgi:hypothetical protein